MTPSDRSGTTPDGARAPATTEAHARQSEARRARVRSHWTPPPGPLPAGDGGDPTLLPGEGETLDALAGEWRIFQRRDGHRYSTDDLLTAWYAASLWATRGPELARYVDLGAGIGSVAMIAAWRLRHAAVLAIEAQALSSALCARSLRYNGLTGRATAICGDLRTVAFSTERSGWAELVTGSPPYFPVGSGTVSRRPQCDPCRFERRGGVEAYAAAAAHLLQPGGLFVLVHEDRASQRVLAAGRDAGLHPCRRRAVVFREGRAPLIALYAFEKPAADRPTPTCLEETPLLIRTRDGQRSPEYRALREWIGFPP